MKTGNKIIGVLGTIGLAMFVRKILINVQEKINEDIEDIKKNNKSIDDMSYEEKIAKLKEVSV